MDESEIEVLLFPQITPPVDELVQVVGGFVRWRYMTREELEKMYPSNFIQNQTPSKRG